MADMHEHSSNASSEAAPMNHLGTNGRDPEKGAPMQDNSMAAPMNEKPPADIEEDADMDALIDELESQDGHAADAEEVEDEVEAGGARPVSEELLATNINVGLTEQEVATRRKKFGLNQLKEEKENLVLKFLGYFVGPIQFVMEVRSRCSSSHASQ